MDIVSESLTTYQLTITLTLDEARSVIEEPKDFLSSLRREMRLIAAPLPKPDSRRAPKGERAAFNGASSICNVCRQTFARPGNLARHMALRHGAAPAAVPAAE